jgi:hypothetical protein
VAVGKNLSASFYCKYVCQRMTKDVLVTDEVIINKKITLCNFVEAVRLFFVLEWTIRG